MVLLDETMLAILSETIAETCPMTSIHVQRQKHSFIQYQINKLKETKDTHKIEASDGIPCHLPCSNQSIVGYFFSVLVTWVSRSNLNAEQCFETEYYVFSRHETW